MSLSIQVQLGLYNLGCYVKIVLVLGQYSFDIYFCCCQEEGKALMKAAASTFTSGSVISLTGSNPMVWIAKNIRLYGYRIYTIFYSLGFDINEVIETIEKLHFHVFGCSFGWYWQKAQRHASWSYSRCNYKYQ